MNRISIDPTKCNKDGICISSCPFGLLVPDGEGVPVPVEMAPELCVNCGHCLCVCPTGAVTLNEITADDCTPVQRDLTADREQVTQLFRARRSIRAYKDEPVEREILEQLLDLSRWAPTARNLQPVHWLVLTAREDIATLSRMTGEWLRHRGVYPGVVEAIDNGHDMINRNAPCLLIAHTASDAVKPVEDCSIALTTVEAAAPAFGLGACWAGFLMTAAKEEQAIAEFLKLPQNHAVQGALMLGKPKFRYQRIPPRDALKVVWR